MKTNTQFKQEALDALRGNWGKGVLVTLVFILLSCMITGPSVYQSIQMQEAMQEFNLSSPASIISAMADPEYIALQQKSSGASSLTFLLEVFLLFPLAVGFVNCFRKLLVQGDTALLKNMFCFSNYWKKVGGMLLMYVFIALWTLLLIIPGIIKAFSYSMTPYLLDEYPQLSPSEAIHRSRMMMRGHKFDLFWLLLSFIGWAILSIITGGIGFLWLYPYMQTALASFYEEVKADYELNGGLD